MKQRVRFEVPKTPNPCVSPVLLDCPANTTHPVSIQNKFYCTAVMCRPFGDGGAGNPAGGKDARLLLPDSLLAES